MKTYKTPADSLTTMTQIVMPNDTNQLNNLMGGNLLCWMDVAGAICARRHAGTVCVTASVDSVSFHSPIRIGEVVVLYAKATRVFNTSMEVRIEVYAEDLNTQERRKSNEAYFTFVALSENNEKVPITPLMPETEEEMIEHNIALRRREMRLIIAGRMRPDESRELKAMFDSMQKS